MDNKSAPGARTKVINGVECHTNPPSSGCVARLYGKAWIDLSKVDAVAFIRKKLDEGKFDSRQWTTAVFDIFGEVDLVKQKRMYHYEWCRDTRIAELRRPGTLERTIDELCQKAKSGDKCSGRFMICALPVGDDESVDKRVDCAIKMQKVSEVPFIKNPHPSAADLSSIQKTVRGAPMTFICVEGEFGNTPGDSKIRAYLGTTPDVALAINRDPRIASITVKMECLLRIPKDTPDTERATVRMYWTLTLKVAGHAMFLSTRPDLEPFVTVAVDIVEEEEASVADPSS